MTMGFVLAWGKAPFLVIPAPVLTVERVIVDRRGDITGRAFRFQGETAVQHPLVGNGLRVFNPFPALCKHRRCCRKRLQDRHHGSVPSA